MNNYLKLKTHVYVNKVITVFVILATLITMTSKLWIPSIYEPTNNLYTNENIYLKDVTYYVDINDKSKTKRIADTIYQTVNVVNRNEVYSTTPIIIISQNDKVLSVYVVEDKFNTEFDINTKISSEFKTVDFIFYDPPPLVANTFVETKDYQLLSDYYKQTVTVDIREYQN